MGLQDRIALGPIVLAALLLGGYSASAAPLPFLYLEPTGPTTVPTVVPVGTSAYQLWVDPSGVNAPGCTPQPPGQGLPTCIGTYGEDGTLVAEGSLTITASLDITGAPAFALSNLLSCPVTVHAFTYQNCSTILLFVAGDSINGNSTPFQIGTLTIANDGSGAGDLSLGTAPGSATYVDANFVGHDVTTPQVLAVAAPEPGTLLLLGAGLGGLAAPVRVHRRRMR